MWPTDVELVMTSQPLQFAAMLILQSSELPAISLGEAAMRVFLATLFIAVFGFGIVVWIRTKANPSVSGSPGSLKSLLSTVVETPKNGEIKVLEVRKIGSGQSLINVSWNGRRMLLGRTGQSITLLSDEDVSEVSDR